MSWVILIPDPPKSPYLDGGIRNSIGPFATIEEAEEFDRTRLPPEWEKCYEELEDPDQWGR